LDIRLRISHVYSNIIKPSIASYLRPMNLSIDRTTLLAIIIPMVALLFVGFISYQNTIQFIQYDTVDDRIDLIIQRLEHLVSTITDAETGQRGYIITDRLDYLQPYNSALRDIHRQLANLDMMIANEPVNRQLSLNELNILKGLIEAKLAELNQTITLRQLHGINAVLPIILSNRGKVIMDDIRATALDIENQQKNLLAMYTNQSHAYAQNIAYSIIITALVAAAIIGVSVFVINRGIHKRHFAIQRSLQTEVEKRTVQLQIANNQLLVANEKLMLHDKMQQEFINVAAHELRTPIQPILSLTQILHSKIKDSQQQEFLDIVYRNAKRLNKLSEEILYVTRVETQTLELKKEQFNLNEVILHTIDDIVLSKEFTSKNLKLLYEPHDIFLRGDKSRIAVVISNLLSNALKFTAEGAITISVQEGKDDKNEKNWANVNVKDTGRGIDVSILPRLFTKFASKSYQGTGLGLFISKGIVEAHLGGIWGKNNVDGKGATFSFSLPTL
jgi:signal transduction histidine kinase